MVVVQIFQSGLIAWPGVKRLIGYGSPTFCRSINLLCWSSWLRQRVPGSLSCRHKMIIHFRGITWIRPLRKVVLPCPRVVIVSCPPMSHGGRIGPTLVYAQCDQVSSNTRNEVPLRTGRIQPSSGKRRRSAPYAWSTCQAVWRSVLFALGLPGLAGCWRCVMLLCHFILLRLLKMSMKNYWDDTLSLPCEPPARPTPDPPALRKVRCQAPVAAITRNHLQHISQTVSLPEGMGVSREAEFASEIGLAMEVYGWEINAMRRHSTEKDR